MQPRRTAVFSWLFVGSLAAVCATLGVLQYRWISEVSAAARDHMRDGLRARLARLGQDFDAEIANASLALSRRQGASDPRAGVFASKSAAGPAAVEIRVADRGRGIPEDEQGRIFDPFFRGARALQEQIHGAGLGLSLVKKIVEAHGGAIRVKSAPHHGSEFILRIPAAPPAPPRAQPCRRPLHERAHSAGGRRSRRRHHPF